MFNTYRKVLGVIGIIFCLFSSVFAYSGGSGEPNDPYQIAAISDWQQLMNTSSDWNKYFIMTVDVNLQGVELIPVGGWGPDFDGIFDGNGHIIRNANINMPHNWVVGLFGYSNGQIRNLGVVDVNISGYDYIGGLVGYNNGTITSCYATGSVNGNDEVGGLAGRNGRLGPAITDCYSTATVVGNSDVGGLTGLNYGIITACYTTGVVDGNSNVGGLVGRNNDGTINNSFWDVDSSGQTTSAGGTGKITAEMKTLSTFTSVGWDFVDTWNIGENQTYPFLRKYSISDLNYDDIVNFVDLALFAENWLAGQ